MPDIDRFLAAAGRLLRVIESSDLPTPDRVSYFAPSEQLQIHWREQDYGPVFDLEKFGDAAPSAVETSP